MNTSATRTRNRNLTGVTHALATWNTRHPWLWAVALGLGGTILTIAAVAFSQVRSLTETEAAFVQALVIGVSALVGLAIMGRTKPSLAEYGFLRPRRLADTLWLLPLAVLPLIVLLTTEQTVTAGPALGWIVLAAAVGLNEEIWFRGLLQSALRRLGSRKAVVGGSAIFGVLHLTNLLSGAPLLDSLLQFAFACLVGLVLAELVEITGSLWIGIVWHCIYDAIAFSSSDVQTVAAQVGTVVMAVLMAAYAVWLWRLLPGGARHRES